MLMCTMPLQQNHCSYLDNHSSAQIWHSHDDLIQNLHITTKGTYFSMLLTSITVTVCVNGSLIAGQVISRLVSLFYPPPLILLPRSSCEIPALCSLREMLVHSNCWIHSRLRLRQTLKTCAITEFGNNTFLHKGEPTKRNLWEILLCRSSHSCDATA